MPGSGRRALHPLLLEREYWGNRLRELHLARPSVLLIPRPELSNAALEVDEFRVRTHDGIRLFGLRAQSRVPGTATVRVRMLGPCDSPEIDRQALSGGGCEFVFQEVAGRRLEDRVMDVLRVCHLAAAQEGGSASAVRLVPEVGASAPDEFLIASQLLAEETDCSALAPLGDGDETAGLN
jgi:hypothetical protein